MGAPGLLPKMDLDTILDSMFHGGNVGDPASNLGRGPWGYPAFSPKMVLNLNMILNPNFKEALGGPSLPYGEESMGVPGLLPKMGLNTRKQKETSNSQA